LMELRPHLKYWLDARASRSPDVMTAYYQAPGERFAAGTAEKPSCAAAAPSDPNATSSSTCDAADGAGKSQVDSGQQDGSDHIGADANKDSAGGAECSTEAGENFAGSSMSSTGDGSSGNEPAAGVTEVRGVKRKGAPLDEGESTTPGEGTSADAQDGGEAKQDSDEAPRKAILLTPAWREGALAAAEFMLKRQVTAAKPGTHAELMLRQIRYSQESIKGFFRDDRPIAQMRNELGTGQKKVTEIPKISVVVQNGQVYSGDNRRLWTFKHSGMPLDSRVPVVVGRSDDAFHRKLTTPTGGLTVRRRQEDGFGGGL